MACHDPLLERFRWRGETLFVRAMSRGLMVEHTIRMIRMTTEFPYVVMLDDGQVIYRCETISQGVAFLVGRREGVLYGVLCRAAPKESRPERGKPKKRRIYRR